MFLGDPVFKWQLEFYLFCFLCRFWFVKIAIFIGILVGAFYIPRGTFGTGILMINIQVKISNPG